MLILNKESIQKVFTMEDAIQSAKKALCLYSSGKSVVPLRVNIDIPAEQAQSLFMPAYVEDLQMVGIKIVSVFPKNITIGKSTVPAQMVLVDGTSGEICAILDGTYLTQLRTGALQGAATDILARKNAKIAALFGTGGQAETQLLSMLTVRNLDEVRVFDIDLDRAKKFVSAMNEKFSHFKTQIIAVASSDEAIKEADIITTITTATQPVFDPKIIKSGVHINAIGGYMPHMQEISELIISTADKIIFDTKEGVFAEAGDIIIPLQKGLINKNDIDGELGEVILNKVSGREFDTETTLFKAVGTAVLDLVTAVEIYQNAQEIHVGQTIIM